MRRVAYTLFFFAILLAFGAILPINHERILLKWWSGWEGHLPLAVLLLFTFCMGMVYAIFLITASRLLKAVERRESVWGSRAQRKAMRFMREGNELIKAGRALEAEEILKKALKLFERSDKIHEALGRAYLKQGKNDEAHNEFGLATAYNPEDPELVVRLAELSIQEGDPSRAVMSLQKATEMDPENSNAHRLMPEAFAENGRWEEAVEAQKSLIKNTLKPMRAPHEETLLAYRFEYARKFADTNPKKATKLLNDILKQNPAFIPVALSMAEIQVTRGKHGDAFSTLAKVFKVRPEPFLYERIVKLDFENSFERAEELAEEVLQDDPRYHALRIIKAKVRLDLNLAGEALGELEKISGNPEVEQLLLEASALLKLGDIDKAKKTIGQAVETMSSRYSCSKCGWRSRNWTSRCTQCRSFNTVSAALLS